MISLKKLLEQGRNATVPAEPVAATVTLPPAAERPAGGTTADSEAWQRAWRGVMFAVCDSVERAIPPLGPNIRQKLAGLARTLQTRPSPETLMRVNEAACGDLTDWSEAAVKYYSDHQRELREIIAVVARTAEAIGQRDDRYAQEIGGMTNKLRSAADESDITTIRRSIAESAGAMQTCVTRMAREGRETIRQLTAQTDEYRRRLQEAERSSVTDPLTGVVNRRGLERDMARRMHDNAPFSVVVMDLDGFKELNDTHGHATGDDLLRQFAAELISQFPAGDMVARLGGDEFIGVVSGHASEVEGRVRQIRSWVMGNYKVDSGAGKIEVRIQASLGSAAWNGRETADELLARADQLMYESKRARKAEMRQKAA